MILEDLPGGNPRATVVAFHGFTRSPRHLTGLARGCVDLRLAVLRPAISAFWWPRSANNSAFLSSLANALAPSLRGPVLIAGHSAGASAGAWVAARLIEAGVAVHGIVLLDGVDGPGRFIERSWPVVSQVPVRAVLAPPSACNRQGRLEHWLAAAQGDIVTTVVAGAGHGDIEDGNPLVYRIACRRGTSEAAHERFLAAALADLDSLAPVAP